MAKLLHKDEVYATVGAAMEVYNALGSGFLEPVYQEALEIELTERGIPFEAQKELRLSYKGAATGEDLFCRLCCFWQSHR